MNRQVRLFAIGGQPVPTNFRLLLDLCVNGRSKHIPHIALIAHAAKYPIIDGAASAEDLRALGAQVTILTPGSHKNLPYGIDCIYMRGGDQSRMIKELKEDGLLTQIVAAAARGILIAGNSAGTAGLSAKMIAGGMANDTLIACGQLEYATGLGLVDKIIPDTHIDHYDRWTRLMAISAENPDCIVVGVEEGTAVYITPEGKYEKDGAFILEVSGTSHVYIVSQGSRFSTNLNSCERGEGGRRIIGLDFSVLSKGDRILIPRSRKASDIKLLSTK